MGIITRLIVGLVAGFFADKVFKNAHGMWGDLLIGITGSFVGTWIFGQFGIGSDALIEQILYAFVGAVVLLFVLGLIWRKK